MYSHFVQGNTHGRQDKERKEEWLSESVTTRRNMLTKALIGRRSEPFATMPVVLLFVKGKLPLETEQLSIIRSLSPREAATPKVIEKSKAARLAIKKGDAFSLRVLKQKEGVNNGVQSHFRNRGKAAPSFSWC